MPRIKDTLENKGKIMVFVIVIFFDNVINPLGELEIWEIVGHHWRTEILEKEM